MSFVANDSKFTISITDYTVPCVWHYEHQNGLWPLWILQGGSLDYGDFTGFQLSLTLMISSLIKYIQ